MGHQGVGMESPSDLEQQLIVVDTRPRDTVEPTDLRLADAACPVQGCSLLLPQIGVSRGPSSLSMQLQCSQGRDGKSQAGTRRAVPWLLSEGGKKKKKPQASLPTVLVALS